MSHIPKVMDAFARLLSYPDQHSSQAAELLYVVLRDEIDGAGREMSRFGEFLEQHDAWQIEEAFTGTFDVNPTCALEVGWHLFGEEYARGMFLVRMREEMRKYDLAESVELPDHISHVLAIVAAMPDDEAVRFVKACVQPAIAKMNDALARNGFSLSTRGRMLGHRDRAQVGRGRGGGAARRPAVRRVATGSAARIPCGSCWLR